MGRTGFSINNFANNEDDELKGSNTSEFGEKSKDERNSRKEQSTVLEATKKIKSTKSWGEESPLSC